MSRVGQRSIATFSTENGLLQLRVLLLGLLQDGDVGVGVFPESKKRSPRHAHAFEQVEVAWIGVKRFKILFGLYVLHARRPLRVALFQPLEGMIAISHQPVVTRHL